MALVHLSLATVKTPGARSQRRRGRVALALTVMAFITAVGSGGPRGAAPGV